MVIWSKSKTDAVKIRHYNINIKYLYIVSNDRVPEIENDQMTLTK